MDSDRFSKSSDTKQEYLATLRGKIRTKFQEAQRKLEKSRSLDTLHTCIDDFSATNQNEVYFTVPKKDFSRHEDSKSQSEVGSFLTAPVQNVDVHDVFDPRIESYFSSQEVETPEIILAEEESSYEFVNLPSDENSAPFQEKNPTQPNPTNAENSKNTSDASETKLSFSGKIKRKIASAKEKRRSRNLDKHVLINSKTSEENVHKVIFSNSPSPRHTSSQIKFTKRNRAGKVTVSLLKAHGLKQDGTDGKNTSLSCRFRLGTEKTKSKAVKCINGKCSWMEHFHLNLHEDNSLEISLCDKDTVIGRTSLDVSEYEVDVTHKLETALSVSDTQVNIHMLLTVTGLQPTAIPRKESNLRKSQSMAIQSILELQNFVNFDEVGVLSVSVYGAKGLSITDSFCILDLDNQRVHTYTEFKTNEPTWLKRFNFTVHDITSILEVTIYDDKRNEEHAKISIPLLRIQNDERKWFALKDIGLRERVKGHNPRICLKMSVTWDLFKASTRVINPKEEKLLGRHIKLDRRVFARNLVRVKAVIAWVVEVLKVIRTCFEWESVYWNLTALICWITFCWNFKAWMLPLLFIIPFFWYHNKKNEIISYISLSADADDDVMINVPSTSIDREAEEEKGERTLLQRFQSLQDMVLVVQNAIGVVASYGESIKNLYKIKVPFLSYLAIFFIVTISTFLFMVPTKYIFIAWSLNKFTRKTLKPNRVPNNEILDLLSRVPDDELLLDFQELELEEISSSDEYPEIAPSLEDVTN